MINVNGMITELHPRIDKAKSFYGKALVTRETLAGIDIAKLYSYETLIATVATTNRTTTIELTDDWNYSKTTLRHLHDFLYQLIGLKVEHKALKTIAGFKGGYVIQLNK